MLLLCALRRETLTFFSGGIPITQRGTPPPPQARSFCSTGDRLAARWDGFAIALSRLALQVLVSAARPWTSVSSS
jgi:hypothetical protein